MRIAVVILNWNGRNFLEKFLPGLVASMTADAEVIVADNASEDGSMEMMKEKFPGVKTMIFSRNWGFTGGYNRALMQLDAEYHVLINSDIEVSPDWLSPLVEWMDTHPDCGICAPKLLSMEAPGMFEYAGAAGGYIDRFGYPFCRGRILKMVEKDKGQYDSPAEVFWASGACMMIRSSLYNRLGGLDERFFAHMEEIDLCWRAQLSGSKVCIVPASKVCHIGGGTLPNNSPWKLYLNYRNNLLMLKNNLSRTIALGLYHRGNDIRTSAAVGLKRARKTIRQRMFLDGIAAAVYLVSFRWKYFKAVFDAHRDFRRLRHDNTEKDISDYLARNGKKASVTGMYGGWIVPFAIFARERTFGIVDRKFRQEFTI